MKMNRIVLATILGLTAMSTNAATDANPTKFDSVVKDAVFSVTAKGWSDPAFGDAGWTHSSQWGLVSAKKGQTVTITSVADNKSVHPGATVWYRGEKDTAPDNFFVDHFYQQTAGVFKNGVADESITVAAGEKAVSIGNIVMKYITHGFDLDNNTVLDESGATDSARIVFLKGKKDGVAGKLNMTFKAPYDGNYMFVVAGFNPDKNYVATTGTDGKALKESVKVSVSVR